MTTTGEATERKSGAGPLRRRKAPNGVSRRAVMARWALPITLLVAWQAWFTFSPSYLIPTPLEIVVAFVEMLRNGELAEAMWLSNQAFLIGTAAGLGAGLVWGMALGRSRSLDRLFGVYIDIDLALPTIALLPIVIIIFGLGLPARSIVVFTFVFAMVVSLIRAGARTVDPGLIEMGRAFAPRWNQLWTMILLPGLLPALGGAIRLAISRGVVGMVIVELVLTTVGIGGVIMDSRALFQADRVFAGVLAICIEAVVLMALGRLIEKKIAPHGMHGGDA